MDDMYFCWTASNRPVLTESAIVEVQIEEDFKVYGHLCGLSICVMISLSFTCFSSPYHIFYIIVQSFCT